MLETWDSSRKNLTNWRGIWLGSRNTSPLNFPSAHDNSRTGLPGINEPPPDANTTITCPMEFDLGVEPYFHYKIEGNFLYEREGSGWKLIQACG